MLDINRALVVVKPKQPFLDWLCSIDEAELKLDLDELREDTGAYLVPEWGTNDEQWEVLRWAADYIFEQELWGWYTDPALWPMNRDFDTFLQWFDVEFHCMVFDADEETPLEHEDYSNDRSDASTDVDPNSNGH